MKKSVILLFWICFMSHPLFSQDSLQKKVTLNGYASFMQTIMDVDPQSGDLQYESQLHNRLNSAYAPLPWLSFSLQARNRLIMGDRFRSDYGDVEKNTLGADPGLVDLSFNLLEGESFVLNTSIDRFWMKYTLNRWELTVGRQRINWGLTYVWNPNDWFNNFSFFDFDYPERPGSDAIKITYYTGNLSGIETVLKSDSTGRITAAVLGKLHAGSYDFQILGGILSSEDLGMGFGWAGGIGNVGFRGEMSYFHPVHHAADTTGLLLLSVSLDYTFRNSLTIQAEVLYNQVAPGQTGGFLAFYRRPLSVKDLSFTPWNLCFQASYPLSPLVSTALAVLYFPEIAGYYIGPSLTWSMGDNLDFSLIAQVFNGEVPDMGRQTLSLGFLRLKYSF